MDRVVSQGTVRSQNGDKPVANCEHMAPLVGAASAQVEALGGRKLQVVEKLGIRWMVMADPDGNEFCLDPPHARG